MLRWLLAVPVLTAACSGDVTAPVDKGGDAEASSLAADARAEAAADGCIATSQPPACDGYGYFYICPSISVAAAASATWIDRVCAQVDRFVCCRDP